MDKYKSVAEVILEDMTPEQRDQLATTFIQALKKIGVHNVMAILPLLTNDHSVKVVALDALKDFLTNQGYALK